ncbi:Glia maturation factor beta [Nymphon striatum]|nr:Glia maturation factor beta [Nymphon striatum]
MQKGRQVTTIVRRLSPVITLESGVESENAESEGSQAGISHNLNICDMDEDFKATLKKFRFQKFESSAGIIMKIHPEKLKVIVDEEFEDVDIDELREMLPCHQPRFTLYTSKMTHADGRVSFPMAFFFTTPRDCKPELQMMYAGSKIMVVNECSVMHVFELRELEELTQEWYDSKIRR